MGFCVSRADWPDTYVTIRNTGPNTSALSLSPNSAFSLFPTLAFHGSGLESKAEVHRRKGPDSKNGFVEVSMLFVNQNHHFLL